MWTQHFQQMLSSQVTNCIIDDYVWKLNIIKLWKFKFENSNGIPFSNNLPVRGVLPSNSNKWLRGKQKNFSQITNFSLIETLWDHFVGSCNIYLQSINQNDILNVGILCFPIVFCLYLDYVLTWKAYPPRLTFSKPNDGFTKFAKLLVGLTFLLYNSMATWSVVVWNSTNRPQKLKNTFHNWQMEKLEGSNT